MRAKRVILAKGTGFCFGVKRAIEMAEAALEKKGPIYSLGSIIHNRQVVRDLASRGLKVLKGIGRVKSGTVIISSHGVSPKTKRGLIKRGLKVIDTTCPFVKKAQEIARNLARSGYTVVIVGDRKHPEVKALVDFAGEKAFVVRNTKEAAKVRVGEGDRLSLISQTTQSADNFLAIARRLAKKKPKEFKVFKTICRDAGQRQDAAKRLVGSVDVMLIVGGANSANTRRLFEVCKRVSRNSHLVETEVDLRKAWFRRCSSVGIASGASTPDWIVKRVVDRVSSKMTA